MFKFIHTKTAKFLFYGFVGFIMFKACTSETPKTFESYFKPVMLPHAENSIKAQLKYPDTYKQVEWEGVKTSDSTGMYIITFTSSNSFNVPVRNQAVVEFKYNTERVTGRITNTLIK